MSHIGGMMQTRNSSTYRGNVRAVIANVSLKISAKERGREGIIGCGLRT
jgi:hypothetical protein